MLTVEQRPVSRLIPYARGLTDVPVALADDLTRRTGKVANDDRADWREAWALFPGDVAYIWHAAIHATTVTESLIAYGFDIRAQIVR